MEDLAGVVRQRHANLTEQPQEHVTGNRDRRDENREKDNLVPQEIGKLIEKFIHPNKVVLGVIGNLTHPVEPSNEERTLAVMVHCWPWRRCSIVFHWGVIGGGGGGLVAFMKGA
jgi:hypothetical protein